MAGIGLNPSGCCCAPPCLVTFTVRGVSSNLLSGAVATIWTDATKATTLGTGTTDCTGKTSIPIPPTLDFYWEVDHPSGRLAKTTGTNSCGGTGSSISTTLSTVTSGYYGVSWAALPLPSVMHYSDPFNGPVTLNHSGSAWTGTTSTSFPGGTIPFFGTCTANTQTVTISIPATGTATTVTFKRTGTTCSYCAGGTNTVACNNGSISVNCSGGVTTFSISWLGRAINPVDNSVILGTLTE